MGTTSDHLKVGLVTGGDLARAAALETLPIDSLWTGGHVSSPNPSSEPIVTLAQLSAVTTRVELGTAILPLPLYQPAIVAKQIAELDHACGGRLTLGVGVGGEYPQEFRACQVPLAERGRRTDEAIDLLRKLWTAEELSHDGPFFPMEQVRIMPAPLQVGGPPIVVAGRKEAAMRRAALRGDGWMPYLYSPRRYAASVETISRAADEAGRDLSEFGWFSFVFVNINSDGDQARLDAARSLGGLYRQDVRPMIDRVAVAGTPREVIASLTSFVEAGARHLVVLPAPGAGAPDLIIERFVDEVLPAVREAADG